MLNKELIKENILLISPTQDKVIDYYINKTIKYLSLYLTEIIEEHQDLVEELTIYNIEVWKQAGVAEETLSERKIVYKTVEMSDLLICLLRKYNIPLIEQEQEQGEEGGIIGW